MRVLYAFWCYCVLYASWCYCVLYASWCYSPQCTKARFTSMQAAVDTCLRNVFEYLFLKCFFCMCFAYFLFLANRKVWEFCSWSVTFMRLYTRWHSSSIKVASKLHSMNRTLILSYQPQKKKKAKCKKNSLKGMALYQCYCLGTWPPNTAAGRTPASEPQHALPVTTHEGALKLEVCQLQCCGHVPRL